MHIVCRSIFFFGRRFCDDARLAIASTVVGWSLVSCIFCVCGHYIRCHDVGLTSRRRLTPLTDHPLSHPFNGASCVDCRRHPGAERAGAVQGNHAGRRSVRSTSMQVKPCTYWRRVPSKRVFCLARFRTALGFIVVTSSFLQLFVSPFRHLHVRLPHVKINTCIQNKCINGVGVASFVPNEVRSGYIRECQEYRRPLLLSFLTRTAIQVQSTSPHSVHPLRPVSAVQAPTLRNTAETMRPRCAMRLYSAPSFECSLRFYYWGPSSPTKNRPGSKLEPWFGARLLQGCGPTPVFCQL